jgi:hypothetical protein
MDNEDFPKSKIIRKQKDDIIFVTPPKVNTIQKEIE